MNASACKHDKGSRAWKPYALGAAVAAALLATTACESNAADDAADSKPSDRPSATSSVKPGETASAKPGGSSGNTGGNADNGGKGDSTDNAGNADNDGKGDNGGRDDSGEQAAIAACAQDALAVSAVKEPADSKEARHLLITVQNVGDGTCNLYHYPYLRLGADAQTTVPVIKDSAPDPGAPVTIAPGEEAYAALLVSGGGRDEYEANSVTLSLQGAQPGSTAGGPVDVPLPVGTLYADDGQLVTYWTTASGMALDFIMSK